MDKDGDGKEKKVNWSGTRVEPEREQGFYGCQVHRKFNLHQAHKKREPHRINFDDDLILDTSVEFNSIKNKSLLAGVYVAKNPIQMCTNMGERLLEQRGILLGMDNNPWLDENSMANILSFGELSNQY